MAIPVRAGFTIDCDILRPDSAEKFPAILIHPELVHVLKNPDEGGNMLIFVPIIKGNRIGTFMSGGVLESDAE